MGGWLLFLATTASIVPLVLGYSAELGPPEGRATIFALSLLPWMALVGAPRIAAECAWRSGARILACASPILVLAARLDSERGEADALASGVLAWSMAAISIAALHFAAARAGKRARSYGFAWVMLVVGAPALGFVLRNFSSTTESASTLVHGEMLENISPLSFCLRLAAGRAEAHSASALASLSVSLVVIFLAAEFDRRRWRPPSERSDDS